MPDRNTTNAIFSEATAGEVYGKEKETVLLKAFNRIPQEVLWRAIRKLGFDEWLVRVVQSMYHNMRSHVQVRFSNEFEDLAGFSEFDDLGGFSDELEDLGGFSDEFEDLGGFSDAFDR